MSEIEFLAFIMQSHKHWSEIPKWNFSCYFLFTLAFIHTFMAVVSLANYFDGWHLFFSWWTINELKICQWTEQLFFSLVFLIGCHLRVDLHIYLLVFFLPLFLSIWEWTGYSTLHIEHKTFTEWTLFQSISVRNYEINHTFYMV